MEQLNKLSQIFDDLSRIVSSQFDPSRVDARLYGLYSARASLGSRALEVIKLGLSRPVALTVEDAEKLISEWECRNSACCFEGSVEDLLALKDTLVLAVSFKHDDRSRWHRKGDNFTSKMGELDQKALVDAIAGLAVEPKTEYVVLWCDQILSTRLTGQENSFGWYNAGLLPYVCVPVLTLSAHLPDNELEQRIWIKAERSLGRLGQGVLHPEDPKVGVYLTMPGLLTETRIIKNLASMILSGYWPEDKGFWSNDYRDMKTWALGLLCRANRIIEPPLFEKIKPLDNLEILESLSELVAVPPNIDFDEPPIYTDDPFFFLKATAWNLSLEGVWNDDKDLLSHYMGRLDSTSRFSWWIEKESKSIFGCFVTREGATLVLAVRSPPGYKVFRRGGDPRLYHHQELIATEETKKLLKDIAQRFGVNLEADAVWSLLYSCDEGTKLYTIDRDVRTAMGDCCAEVDAIVPLRFFGATIGLFKAAVANRGDESRMAVANMFVRLFAEWNDHIRKTYDRWISMRDTLSGPVWLEGYTEDKGFFGFLDFLTRRLITNKTVLDARGISLPTKWEVVREVKEAAGRAPEDFKLIAKELYDKTTEHNCESLVTSAEVARFMLSGGLNSGFWKGGLSKFLKKSAQLRGFWSTDITVRSGKMQITFDDGRGSVRLVQRETELKNFFAIGIVNPHDARFVREISEEVTDDAEEYRASNYWKGGMADNVEKTELVRKFERSCGNIGDGRVVCLVDMSVWSKDGSEICSVLEVNQDEGAVAPEEKWAQMRNQLLSIQRAFSQQEVVGSSEHVEEIRSGAEGTSEFQFDRVLEESWRHNEESLKLQEEASRVAGESIRLFREVGRGKATTRAKSSKQEEPLASSSKQSE